MFLSQNEATSLQSKIIQYRCLLKKAIMVIFLFNNTAKLDNVKKVVNVFMLFKEFCGQLMQQFGKNSYKRISDYENMAFEVM